MNKIVIGDFVEYNSPSHKLGNYHICNQFVRNGYEALWISNTFNELIFFKDRADYRHKKSLAKPIRHQLADNVYGFAAWSWRLYGNYPLCANPRIIAGMPRTIVPNVRDSMARMGFDQADVLWISNPKLYWLADVIHYDRLVYRIADDYSQFRDFPNISELEASFIKKADHIFITSHLFEEKVQNLGKKPVFLKNAADTELFGREQPVPEEYRNRGRKRIVYVGTIHYWFDIELVARLAENADADVFIIGPEVQNLDRLRGYSNVNILGPREFSRVPSYMQHADVAIVPFVIGDLTAAISPLKVFEYCAAGTPVVSTYMAEVAQMQAPIHIARDQADFIGAVKKSLESPKPSGLLREYAAQNSWAERFKTIMKEFNGYEC